MPDPDSDRPAKWEAEIRPAHRVKPDASSDDVYGVVEPEPLAAEQVARPKPRASSPDPERQPPVLQATPSVISDEVMEPLDRLFSRPVFFRIVARCSAVLSALILLGSVLLTFFGHSWFEGAAIFALIFVVGEAAAAILETLQRGES